MAKLKVIITFSLNSPYHSTGDRLAFGIDKGIYLHQGDSKNETPAIPATSLKGIIRSQVEAIFRANGINVCPPRPDEMCKNKDNACIVCKFFGAPRIKSPLIFQDAVLKNSTIDSRVGVGIERRRKTAKEDHLFSYEIGHGNELSTEINGHLPENRARKVCALLFLGAKTSFAVGGGKSRGLGWIDLKEFRAFVDDKELTIKEIENELREILKI